MSLVKKISVIGSGNWGSAIAKIIGENVVRNDNFHKDVPMYVYEEMVEGQKLSEIINKQHENVKYLPGIKLPKNVIAVTDPVSAAQGSDILVFVLPHQFIGRICQQLSGKVKPGAQGISLIKGLDIGINGLQLISNVISNSLGIPCAVLMGANVAGDVAKEDFCEATIGCKDAKAGQFLKSLLQTPYFRLTVVTDKETVELCGALKNIVAVGAGFIDGLKLGDNTKAAVIRLGLMEMIQFSKQFFNNTDSSTFFESCGVADLITTCYGGRNRRVAEAFVTSGKSIAELEKDLLNGQLLQGPQTADEVGKMLAEHKCTDKYPLFTAVDQICKSKVPVKLFLNSLANHPAHL